MSPVNWTRTRSITFWLRNLGIVVILSFTFSAYAVVKQSQAAAERTADKKAQAVTQVGQCFQSRRDAPAVLHVLDLIDTLATNSITVTRESLNTALPGDPLTPVRKAALERLIPARRDLRVLVARTKTTIPTLTKCNELARTLGVDPSKLNNP